MTTTLSAKLSAVPWVVDQNGRVQNETFDHYEILSCSVFKLQNLPQCIPILKKVKGCALRDRTPDLLGVNESLYH